MIVVGIGFRRWAQFVCMDRTSRHRLNSHSCVVSFQEGHFRRLYLQQGLVVKGMRGANCCALVGEGRGNVQSVTTRVEDESRELKCSGDST